MNQRELKKLKKDRDARREQFNKIDQKLRDNCTCPESFMRTEVGYETDTLGSNGTSYYQDFCSVCGKYHDNYGGVYSSYRGGAKFTEAKAKDFR